MDRAMIEQHLAPAQKHVQKGLDIVMRQVFFQTCACAEWMRPRLTYYLFDWKTCSQWALPTVIAWYQQYFRD